MLNWRKEHTISLPKRKETAKTETISKNLVFFEMTGKYVKGEDKEGTEKRIIKSKRIFKKEMHFDKKEKPRKNKYSRKRTKNENVQKTDKN